MEQSRFSDVSRRAFLGGVSAAAILGVTACANDSQLAGTTSGSTTAAKATSAASGTKTSAAAATGPALPASAKAEIAFTYAVSGGGGRVRNPYIAVWIEDGAGNLVRTVSLWHLQGQDRWLSDLKRWYQVSGGDDTGSSATRVAGSYTVSWDGANLKGAKVAGGSYYVCVEAAREHGPYSLVRELVDFGAAKATKNLAANGELGTVAVTYTL